VQRGVGDLEVASPVDGESFDEVLGVTRQYLGVDETVQRTVASAQGWRRRAGGVSLDRLVVRLDYLGSF
jgi:hypothetical protein